MAEIIMAFAPLVFLIVYALKTRKMAESMILATLLAMVLLHRQHFLTGTIDAIYGALSNSSYQFVLCIIIGFGGMITLFQESGALMGFRDLLKIAAGPKRTLVLAWLMSVIMFVDEYLNALTVTFSMREITDKNRIPREHLALQANIMACCLCMTIPFSSWTAFSVGWCRIRSGLSGLSAGHPVHVLSAGHDAAVSAAGAGRFSEARCASALCSARPTVSWACSTCSSTASAALCPRFWCRRWPSFWSV